MRTQKENNSCRESFNGLREYILNHEQNIGRHMDIKGNSGGVSDGNEEQVIETGLLIIEKAILVINWQRTRLNCVLVFYGK